MSNSKFLTENNKKEDAYESYKGKNIRKSERGFTVGGFIQYFDSIEAAKVAIDDALLEDKHLDEIYKVQKDMAENPDSYFEADDRRRYY